MTPNRLRSLSLRVVALLAFGAWWGLAYPANGDFDPTYGVNGRFAGYASMSGVLLANGGAVSATYSAGTLSIQFVDSNGLPNTHVGPAGERLIPLGLGAGRDFGAIELPGGDVLVALHALPQGTTTGTGDGYLVRVSPDGTLNPAFGTNGVWRVAGSGSWGALLGPMRAQPDGKILVTLANFDYLYGCATTLQLRRLLSDGSADVQFGNQGIVTLSPECYTYGDGLLSLLPGGFIDIRNSDVNPLEQLLNGSGTTVRAPTADVQNRLASLQSAALIPGTQLGYMAGAGQQLQDFSIVRLRSDLTPDTSFGSQGTGTVTVTVGPGIFPQSLAPGSAVSASGQHIYGMATSTVSPPGQTAAPALFRLNADGTLDQQFGAAGVVRLNSFGPVYNITDTLEQPGGAVLLSIRGFGVVRLGSAAPGPGVIGFGPTASADTSVTEGTAVITLPVSRSNGSQGAVSVNFHTEDDVALAGHAYQATSGTLNWDDGDVSGRSITIQLLEDPAITSALPFHVVLDSPGGGAIIGSSSVEVFINPASSPAPPPATSTSTNASASEAPAGGGGGGAIGPYAVLVLLIILIPRTLSGRRH